MLSDFIAIDGRPVTRCVLVSLDERVFIEGFETRAAFETIYDYVQMAYRRSKGGNTLGGRSPTATPSALPYTRGNTATEPQWRLRS